MSKLQKKNSASATSNENLDIAKQNILRPSENINPSTDLGKEIHGFDFSKSNKSQGVDYETLLTSFATTGFQATHFSKTIEIINKMRDDKVTIFLGYTSNMVTSGVRDIIRYLVETNQVHIIVTTAGGVEEDIIKCLKPFYLGDFQAPGKDLREKGINRTGNIFVPNDNYCLFENFFVPFLETLYQRQKKGERTTPSMLIRELGLSIEQWAPKTFTDSIYYWAAKNNIPVFCPAITDGSMGDMVYFFKHKRPDFEIDVADDIFKINTLAIEAKKTGIILLGAGVIKHHICNANMFRNGADYAVYINTAQEFDGSDAGARPDEAVSWGKLLPNARTVKLFADATIVFPLIVAETFAKQL